jgi:hypothetical protein
VRSRRTSRLVSLESGEASRVWARASESALWRKTPF